MHPAQSDSDVSDQSGADTDDSDGESDNEDVDGEHSTGIRRRRRRSGGRVSEEEDTSTVVGEPVIPKTPQPTYVLPLASVLTSASVGLLTFLSYGAGGANAAFNWLVSVASVASLQSWAGMLFTYIRFVVFFFKL